MSVTARPPCEARRFERWLELIPYCAREREGVALGTLAERFEDTKPAIVADAQALVEREYYLPGSFADSLTILVEPDWLEIQSPGHFQRPVRLAPLEALAVQLGLQIVAAESPAAEHGALEAAARELALRLAATLSEAGVEPGDATDAGPASDPQPGAGPLAYGPALSATCARWLELLREALAAARTVELVYFKPYEPCATVVHRVAPWALLAVREAWYVLGEDAAAADVRLFRLDRILELCVTDEPCEVPARPAIEDYVDPERVYRGDEGDLEVAIRYSPRIARWIVERYGSAASVEPDGSVVVLHRCKSPWWAVCRALGYGAEAWIAAPERVCALVERALREMDVQMEAA